MRTIEGGSTVEKTQIAIVMGRFYKDINDMLLNATLTGLKAHGVSENEITLAYVPGALEIPLIVKKLAETKSYDAIIALGTVIRGETAHFEYVSGFSSNAIGKIALNTGIPVINGILTVENREQALDRADATRKNKGGEFASAAVEMINLVKNI